jgi:glycosyltransferase involved in cell wall biosynthesis
VKSSKPKVTVLMSVYNSEEFLEKAVNSILNQTFKDFELLIINDGSKDGSLKILQEFANKDDRINLISRENKGLVASLNEGISKAKGQYIARMDSDDMSTHDRLDMEVKYLDENPNIALVGSNYTIIEEKTEKVKVTTNIFTHPKDLALAQPISNQYGHGSIMMRAGIAREMNGYDSDVGHVEDYDLWTRISYKYEIANIYEPLYLYRSVQSGVTLSNHNKQIYQAFCIRDRAFEYFLLNRSTFRLLSWNPGTCDNYREKKSMLYRDYAFMYRKTGHRLKSILLLVLAFALDKKHPNNKKFIKNTLLNRPIKEWEFEFL